MSHHSRPRALRALSAGVLAALTLGLTAGVPSAASAATFSGTYENSAPITIVDNDSANPYPAAISVPAGGPVTSIGDVSVTLHGLTHSFVGDLMVELVSPSGTSVYPMCFQQVGGKDEVSNADVTFSTDGSGEPECDLDDLDLVDLALEDPAGEWDLYVDDTEVADDGQIAGGWSLSFNQSAAPVVTTDPQDVTTAVGRTATFTADASGAPKPAVQWQVSTDGGTTWDDIAGADGRTYRFITQQGDDGHRFRAQFFGPTGTVDSKPATLGIYNGTSAPRNLTAVQTSERTTRVSWTEPADRGASVVMGYRVSATNGVSTVGQTVNYAQTAVDLDLAPNATYTISVVTQYDGTWGQGESPAATTTVSPRTYPTITIPKTSLTAGDSFVIKGSALPHETVKIQKSVNAGSWVDVLTTTADAAGSILVTTKADFNASYHVRTLTDLYSGPANVKVKAKTSMAAKRLSPRRYTLSGTVAPAKAGTPVKVYYRKSSGAYAYLGSSRTGSTGKWAYTRRYPASKTMVFKASLPASSFNAANYRLLTVRVH
ncbi:MAG TPA: proprotein convertase P-domain-containing protein [Nocardioidaceae bacterium]|nr:proprotein convertase P-domain-containing protein [Nocardioidaceae bacterium]